MAIKPGRRFDATFMTFRLLASVPNTVFETLQYLRLSQLFPFALVHAKSDPSLTPTPSGAPVTKATAFASGPAWNGRVAYVVIL